MNQLLAFQEHLKTYTKLFKAIYTNGYDCEEVDNIRDDLDSTYYKLTDEQHQIIGKLSQIFVDVLEDLEVVNLAFKKSLEEETSCTYDDRIGEARQERLKKMGL